MALLQEAAAPKWHRDVTDQDGRLAREDRVQHRADHVERLGSRLVHGSPEGGRVLVADECDEGLVVDHPQLGTPEQADGERCVHHQVDGAQQGGAPPRHRTQRGGRPVDGLVGRRHRAELPGEDVHAVI